jgi:soluble lytic murein transglycosylase
MRTESYYQPDILSYANARGLMQILPPTGDKIARRMGAAALDYDDLFRPEINIRFGAWYLGALVDEFSGQLPLAFASYNGGPFNVKRWVDQAGDVTLAEFIETIPFDQTRLYVKKILGTMYRYRLLFFGRPALPDLETPLIKAHGDKINF